MYSIQRLLILSLTLFCMSITIYSQEVVQGKIISDTDEILPYASVMILSSQDSALLTHSLADSLGYFSLKLDKLPDKYILRVTYIGYYPYQAEYDKNDVGNICLKANTQLLGEVIIRPNEMKSFASHDTYRLDPVKIKNYSTFLDALSLIPSLMVTGWRTLNASDGGAVLILLNGIKVDEKELLAIDKRSVERVDVYRDPPARFISMGASMAINVITKKNIRGGNVFVDCIDAVTRLDGTHILSAAYNIDKWRFTATYDNVLSQSIYRQDEKIFYSYGGKTYNKEKIGLESPWSSSQHNFKFGLMKIWDNNIQLNATGKVTLHDEQSEYLQQVISSESDLLKASSPTNTKWQSYAWDLYIAKKFDKKREILFDLSGSIYNSHLNSSYIEERITGENFFEENSNVYGLKKNITADLQYSRFFEKATLKLGVRDNFSINNQKLLIKGFALPSNSYINTLDFYSDGSILLGKWKLYSGLGLKQVNFRSPNFNNYFSFFTFKPEVRAYYTHSKPLWFFVFYTIDNIIPNISMLTETPIYKDYKYAFIGNSQLKPYLKHSFTTGGSFFNKYLKISLNLGYSLAKNAIHPFFEERDTYIAETYKNLTSQSDFLVAWNFNYMPLGDPRLNLSSWGNYILGDIEHEGLNWKNNYLRYFFQMTYNVKHWSTMLMYQSASNYMQGLWLIKAPSATVAEISYKTSFGLNVGIGGKYLFTKEYKNGKKTHPDALLQLDRWNISSKTANTIYLKLSYNFSIGRKIDVMRQKINNTDSDIGILTK